MRYFDVFVTTEPRFRQSIYTTTSGRAKYRYLLDLRESWPDASFKDLSVRVASPAILPPKVFVRRREQIQPELTTKIVAFLDSQTPGMTREQWNFSYQFWLKGGDAWNIAAFGGTHITLALMWYHHRHSPGQLRILAARNPSRPD